ncbi:hypothetical protein HOLDEFILI_00945 [Holdemania filiformis DSM 12042]|uniref:Uncharacterized protein n=1 Tax=Holdemania filiformis DSM 12042 TaxID=545696 RepID=B9Y564_9FIRM|nr:hypothetical protein HOLDEFILI_00945 [Holdemania filiformis DSM 12042]
MNNRKIYLQDSSAKVKRKGKSSRNDNEQAPLINQGRLFCFLSLLFTVMTLLKNSCNFRTCSTLSPFHSTWKMVK